MDDWIFRVLVAVDQFFNALFDGDPDETISSRAYKASLKGERWGCVLCKVLNWISRDHCLKSVEWDEGRKDARSA